MHRATSTFRLGRAVTFLPERKQCSYSRTFNSQNLFYSVKGILLDFSKCFSTNHKRFAQKFVRLVRLPPRRPPPPASSYAYACMCSWFIECGHIFRLGTQCLNTAPFCAGARAPSVNTAIVLRMCLLIEWEVKWPNG